MSESKRLLYIALSALAALLPGVVMSALFPNAPGELAFSTVIPGIAYIIVFGSAGENMSTPTRPEAKTWKYAGYVTLFAILYWGILYGIALLWQ